MTFDPKNQITQYIQAPPPALAGSDRLYYDRELKKIKTALDSLELAITEIRGYLKTLS